MDGAALLILRVVSALAIEACVMGCSADSVSDAPPSASAGGVTAVSLSPAAVNLSVGDSIQLVASIIADAGIDRTIVWNSSDVTKAIVSSTGWVRAVGAGVVTILAASRADATKLAAAIVTVVPRQPTSLTNPSITIASISSASTGSPTNLGNVSGSIAVAGQLTAGSVTSDHLELVVSQGARDSIVAVASLSPAQSVGSTNSFSMTFATDGRDARGAFRLANGGYGLRVRVVDRSGNVQASSSTIQITLNNLAPAASVNVSPQNSSIVVGATVQLSAEVRDANDIVLIGRAITWTSSDPSRATISPNGVVTGVASGAVTISAGCEGQRGYATVTINPANVPVANIYLFSPSSSMSVGSTLQLSAATTDANGNQLTNRAITWVSSNPSTATVSNNGLVTGIASGSVTISATSEGKTASTTIAVTPAAPPPVSSVTISPSAPSVSVGGTVQLSATLRDANGNFLVDRVVIWASSDPSRATVSNSGLVIGIAAGSSTISATSEGKTASTIITVATPAPAAVNSVTVSPSAPSVSAGGTLQMSATVRDANGNVLLGRQITWASSDPSRATVGQTSGVVTGIAAGTATITATSEGRSGSTIVTITGSSVPASPTTVVVSPSSNSIFAGCRVQLNAQVKDSNGNVISSAVVQWSSSNGNVASISQAGLVTGISAGTTTITATSGSVAGQASVQVQAPLPAAGSGC